MALENSPKQQLQALADKRKARSSRSAAEIGLVEVTEEFALEDMAKMLGCWIEIEHYGTRSESVCRIQVHMLEIL